MELIELATKGLPMIGPTGLFVVLVPIFMVIERYKEWKHQRGNRNERDA